MVRLWIYYLWIYYNNDDDNDDDEDGGLLEISHDPKVLELGAKGHPASGEH